MAAFTLSKRVRGAERCGMGKGEERTRGLVDQHRKIRPIRKILQVVALSAQKMIVEFTEVGSALQLSTITG